MSPDELRIIATVSDLLGVSVEECQEPLVIIPSDIIYTEYRPPVDELKAQHGNKVYVRSGLAQRLVQAQAILQNMDPELQFLVTYGYRTDYLQHKYFVQQLARIREEQPGIKLSEGIDLAHNWAAFPPVAGHPTGGCIDVTIRNRRTGEELDLGADVYCMGPQSCVGYPDLSGTAYDNRELLRSTLEAQGFHAFRGEFWHYSYGDREWALHNATSAIYSPLPSEALQLAQNYVP